MSAASGCAGFLQGCPTQESRSQHCASPICSSRAVTACKGRWYSCRREPSRCPPPGTLLRYRKCGRPCLPASGTSPPLRLIQVRPGALCRSRSFSRGRYGRIRSVCRPLCGRAGTVFWRLAFRTSAASANRLDTAWRRRREESGGATWSRTISLPMVDGKVIPDLCRAAQ